jgi:hypothetical protein
MVGYKKAIPAQAFCLGQNNKLQQALLERGLLQKTGPGHWEVLTREATVQGEVACDGDFIKLDSIGMPYPVKRDFFLANHVLQEDGTWLQKSRPLRMWCRDEEPCRELQFLLDEELLEYRPAQAEQAFRAFLFGTWQTAPADAVIIFDAVRYDADGQLDRVDFHFVARDEFEKTYHFWPDPEPEDLPGFPQE